MGETWESWEPIKGLPRYFIVESIIDSMKGFTILLSDADDENKRVEMNFGDSVDAYRSTNESYRLKLFNELDENKGLINGRPEALIKVNNSEYVKWLSEQSYETFDTDKVIHFLILGVEFIIDVVASEEPIVTLIKKERKN